MLGKKVQTNLTKNFDLPEILKIPPKLLPILTEFNKYKYFVIEGGRGSAKTQSIARILTFIAEVRKVRIFCGREIQATIEESVYTVLLDLISNYDLAFTSTKKTITHLQSESTFKFKGFREQGAINIKGVEGADIIWVDEAQSLTKTTLDILIPTIRKQNSKVIFTMNRFMRDDAVIQELVGRDDCLHIKINYFENPFCPLTLKKEAEVCKQKSERDYKHIWLGEPLATAGDYLFNYDKIHAAFDVIPYGEVYGRQRVMAIDFAAQGDDQCVATILDRLSNQHWGLTERIPWDESDAMVSVGKIVNLIGAFKPDVCILDVGGMGHVVHNRLQEIKLDVKRFDGATTKMVDTVHYVNARAEGYYILKDWFDNGFLKIDRKDAIVVKELEKIRMRWRSDGKRVLQSKVDMKKDGDGSPDNADSVMMGVYAIIKYLGSANNLLGNKQTAISRKSGSNRKR